MPTPGATPRTVQTVEQVNQSVNVEICRDRPRRLRAIESVHNATRAHETDAMRKRREATLLRAQEAEVRDQARILALEKEIEYQASRPPLTEDEWKAHITSIILPAVDYFNERLNEGGDRHSAYELFQGASIFDPFIAKDISHSDAMALLQKLRHYSVLNKDGNYNIVDRLILRQFSLGTTNYSSVSMTSVLKI